MPLTVIEETRIVALIARGDRFPEIQEQFEASFDKPVSKQTISAVKKRNAENLAVINAKVLAKELADAGAVKVQANRIIKSNLDREEKSAELLSKLSQQYIDGEIDLDKYTEAVKHIKTASLTELVGVSREMHNQTKTEPDAPTSSENLEALRKAIADGDEVTLNQIIFKKGQPDGFTGEAQVQPAQPIQASPA